jgi:predicted transcriptional regulator
VESIEQLMAETYGAVGASEYNRVRAKVSYYVKELEEEGFILKRRAGQKVSIELTQLGRIYVLGQEICELKREMKREE